MEDKTNAEGHRMDLSYRDAAAFDETAQANRKAITDALDAIADGNTDALWDIMDPDVTSHEASCLPYGGVHRGLEAVKQGYMSMAASFPSLHAEMEAVLASRDLVIIYQTVNYTAAGTGKTGSMTVAELFRFREGKVIEWRAHYDDACRTAEALRE